MNNEAGLAKMYLDLLENVLTDYHRYELGEFEQIYKISGAGVKFKVGLMLDKFIKIFNSKFSIGREKKFLAENRLNGVDWPVYADTMVGLKRLRNVRFCAEDIFKNGIEGDFMETGVWRGGTSIFMRALLKVYAVTNKTVWVCDSFEGLPKPNEEKYAADKGDDHYKFKELAISMDQVKANFKKYDLLDDQVGFLKGWFKDTMPVAPVEKLSLLRLDGDMYESTIDVLEYMYPKLSVGGYCLIDDYALAGCKLAVDEYRQKHNITSPINMVDWSGAFWKK